MITIYKASAGSGKTFTLALRYISLLIGWHESVTGRWRLNSPAAPPPARHRAILAVTFTNKATAEMKTRIVETLAALSQPSCPPGNPYMEKLLGIFAPATVAEISVAARRALMQLLFDFGSFNVSTIDSFFQTVLRTFARELNLPDNYRIQLNQQEAIESAVRDMLDVINSNSPYFPDVADADSVGRKERLRKWILDFMESRMSDGKAFNLFNRSTSTFAGITRQLSLLFNETYKLHAPQIDAWLDADSGTRVIKLREALGRRIGQLRHDIITRTDTLLTYTAPFGDKVINHNLASAVKCWTKGEPAKTDTKTMIAVAAGDPDACVTAKYKKDTALSGRILDTFLRNIDDQKQIGSLSFLIRHLYPLGLFGEMRRHLDKFCREENMVLQSNTNDFLSRIISTEQEAPFIYERLGLRLQHFLLDEFQDTSAMQWRILRPLILESLSNGKDNLIIGDGKQSIYGFRNTDFRLLNHIVAQEVGERGYHIDDRGNGPGENVNYRSSHTIVRFNNALFDAIPSVYDLTPSDSGVSVYSGAVQELAEKTAAEPGYVDIAFCQSDQSDSSSDDEDSPGFKQIGLSRMLEGIIRQLRAGYRPKEIAVLVRKRSEGEEVVKHILGAMDTPAWEGLPRVQVMSSDAILVGESPLVKMIVARMRMLLMPDVTPSADDASSPRRAVTHRDITRFVSRFHMHLFTSSEDAAGALDKAIVECSPRLAQEHPYDAASDDRLLYAPAAGLVTLAERIVREAVAGDMTSGTPEAGMHSIYISAFMDMVSDYASHYGNDLRGFLEWWDANRGVKSLSVPDDVDAVNVLTIHKAKGLEFPCVHVPFLSFRMTETSTSFKPSYRWYPVGNIPGIDPELVPPYIPLENKTDLESMPSGIAREFREFIRGQYLDNINLLYVALTRPTRELVVTAQLGKDEKTETIGDALLKGIKAAHSETALKFPLASLLTSEATLVIGEPTSRASSSAPVAKSVTMAAYSVRDNDNLLKITRTAERYIPDFTDPLLRYRFLKRVLAGTRSAASLPVVLRRQAHRSRLDPACAAELLETIRQAIDLTPEAPGWFDGYTRLMLSPEIFVGNVPDIRRWRPDRIVWRADGYIDVVEYCTSALDDKQLANLRSKVRSVMRRLAAMGHTRIRGFLWDIDTPAAHRLTLPSND